MADFWTAKDIGIFGGADQVENFLRMPQIYPVRLIRRSLKPYIIPPSQAFELPETHTFDGAARDTRSFLAIVDTLGLLIIHKGRVVFESYWRGAGPATTSPSFSMSKSFTSALMGVALAAGKVTSVHDRVVDYVPELKGSAYDGPTIKHVLQMSSGARWTEDYADKGSDVFRYAQAMNHAGSLDALAASMTREFEPGTINRYNTMDTHVLGMLLRRAADRCLAELLETWLWQPLGAEADAYFMVDGAGMEMAGAGLHATLRDYARLGLLYLGHGKFNGQQILSADWVQASVTPDAPHLMPGRPGAEPPLGYGYQWWVPDLSGPFFAAGVYNQCIYVDPARELVIAKSSANRNYGLTAGEESHHSGQHLALYETIAKALG